MAINSFLHTLSHTTELQKTIIMRLTYNAHRFLYVDMIIKRSNNSFKGEKGGFTVVEVVITVVVLSVLVGIASFIMGDTVNSAKNNTRKTNALTMNKQISHIKSLGGTIGDGASNDVDTTNMETIVKSLTKNLNVAGITFSLEPKPIPNEYELASDDRFDYKIVKAKLL